MPPDRRDGRQEKTAQASDIATALQNSETVEMFEDERAAGTEGRAKDSLLPSNWKCTKCQTAFRGSPRDRLLDDLDRWRRDRCQHCKRHTVMERT